MQLLAVSIAIVSVTTAAVLSTNSDEPNLTSLFDPDLANLISPDSSPSGSSLLSSTTPDDEWSFIDVNPDKTLDVPESFTSGSLIAQQPGANGADESPIFDPATTYATAQTSEDESLEICPADSSTAQKQKKRQYCLPLEHFLLRPEPPERTRDALTPDQKERIKKKNRTIADEKWINDRIPQNVDQRQRDRVITRSVQKQRDHCNSKYGSNDNGTPFNGEALCCWGPQEVIEVPILGLPIGQSVTLINVFNCLLYLIGRPFCEVPPANIYCCHGLSPTLGDWGYKGLLCLPY